jgi:uncharacterized membrane protein
MKARHLRRQQIHLLSRHSNLNEKAVEELLTAKVYHGKGEWYRFLQLSMLALGAGFTLSGIIFFFAYNWEDLHRFLKLGVIAGLVVLTASLSLAKTFQPAVRKVLLSAAAVLAGVLFAVFGQIYQTGANAYDFFLAWTLFITIWVVVSDFPPLWLGYVLLWNITLMTYMDQMQRQWPIVIKFSVLFFFNAILLIIAFFFSGRSAAFRLPTWLGQTLALPTIIFGTLGVVNGIMQPYHPVFPALLAGIVVLYPLALHHGLLLRRIFWPAVIALSIVVISATWFIKISEGSWIYLFITLFIAGSIGAVIGYLIKLQRKWNHE